MRLPAAAASPAARWACTGIQTSGAAPRGAAGRLPATRAAARRASRHAVRSARASGQRPRTFFIARMLTPALVTSSSHPMDTFRPRPALRRADAAAHARRRRRGHPDARARHRRDDDDVQRRLCDAAEAAAVCRSRPAGHPVQHQRDAARRAAAAPLVDAEHHRAASASATSFESVGSFTGPLFTISGRGDPEHVDGETVSRGYFQALRVQPDRRPRLQRRAKARRRARSRWR